MSQNVPSVVVNEAVDDLPADYFRTALLEPDPRDRMVTVHSSSNVGPTEARILNPDGTVFSSVSVYFIPLTATDGSIASFVVKAGDTLLINPGAATLVYKFFYL